MVDCFMPASPDSLVMAGMAHDDQINILGGEFWSMTTPVLLGGPGSDNVLGSQTTEDILIDNEGNDWLEGGAYDDVLLNNVGVDKLVGGKGSDLLLSPTICGGDTLQGAESTATDGAKNSVSWAKLPISGVAADLETKWVGDQWPGVSPSCSSGSPSWLGNIDDLEGSEQADVLKGNGSPNMVMGRNGNDHLYGMAGDDLILAEGGGSPDADRAEGNGGSNDLCKVDGTDYGYKETCEKVE
jgi:Ca2+-binding RTX toxin-like protein